MSRTLSVLELRSVRGTGGGPEKTILFGAALRDRARFDVTVCYIRDIRDTIFGIGARAAALDIDYVEVRERHSLDPRIWKTLRDLVRDRGIDIVHGHDYKTNLLALLLGRRTGAAPVSTAHGWTGQSARERFVYYPADKRIAARFPQVIAVSTDIKHELVRHGASADRVLVLLNAIDPSAFRRDPQRVDAARRTLGFAPGDIVIGAVGRLERQKRFDLLLEACAPLFRSAPALRLAIVGDGSLRQSLEAQAGSLGLADRCRFLGHQTSIALMHHAFDLFVQSSEYEGTPNAVLEAMAMETPLVATDVGGTRELARHEAEGLMVPARDVRALQEAIALALGDPAGARRRADAARRRIETDLSFDARTRRLERVYDDMVRGARLGSPSKPRPSSVPHA